MKYLTPKQYAKLTGRGVSSIRKACLEGQIPDAFQEEDAGSPNGKRWRIPTPEIKENANVVENESESGR